MKIVITNKQVGKTWLYEKLGQKGRKILVPTYRGIATTKQGVFEFAVTRDTSDIALRFTKHHFGKGGECPPSVEGTPYQAVVHQSDVFAFALRLFDADCPTKNTLKGRGTVQRKNILLHYGPARSEGCLIVAGGKRGYAHFTNSLKRMLKDCPDRKIYVTVQMR